MNKRIETVGQWAERNAIKGNIPVGTGKSKAKLNHLTYTGMFRYGNVDMGANLKTAIRLLLKLANQKTTLTIPHMSYRFFVDKDK